MERDEIIVAAGSGEKLTDLTILRKKLNNNPKKKKLFYKLRACSRKGFKMRKYLVFSLMLLNFVLFVFLIKVYACHDFMQTNIYVILNNRVS